MVTKPLRSDLFQMCLRNERLTRAFEQLFEESGGVTSSNDTIFVQSIVSDSASELSGGIAACPVYDIGDPEPQPVPMPVDLAALIDGDPADGDLLRFNAASGEWEPVTGVSGSFDAATGEIITVTNGVITGIV